jgi:hypothetical protein
MKNFILALMIMMMTAGLAMAQEETGAQPQAPAEDDSFTSATVNGEISGISKKKISMIYDKDYDTGTEYENMVLIDDMTQLRHKKDLSELKIGDLVSIEYEKPGENSKHKALAIAITFIQSGVGNLVSEDRESQASEENATS